ncbi:helix-turn-helix domain-containing protein [Metapseudomonas otitidis]|uniref:helix-turn-helix domain-containing protein n=1 Tax=Metapseudomonas otitidis TaxID=319939 RepID=UPI00244BF90F|nr:helix-turn-helix transcriptional regulator [Pseudomonas otitidis]MDG9784662.1 helix-turn-helix domain-containing protein [Pseudomonas otitidis]
MTPLKKARTDRKWRLADVCERLRGLGENIDTGNLSRIERCEQRASPATAEKLAQVFDGELSELHILYPERYTAAEQGAQTQSVA